MTDSLRSCFRWLPWLAVLACSHGAAWAQGATAPGSTSSRTADFIVAVVGNELVTQVEVNQRMAQAREQANRENARLPEAAELRQKIVETLIDERLQVVNAREGGIRVDDGEVDRAIDNIASMNKMSMSDLRERLRLDGMDFNRFRSNIRDQIASDRAREREVQTRIKITDAELDAYIAEQRAGRAMSVELNIAQILVTVPDGANETVVAERLARLKAAQARLKAGEPFELVAKAVSEDGNKERGGEIGARPADRLPDLFVNAVKDMAVGAVTAEPLRSGAGFHLLKLLSRGDANTDNVTQTRARHILLRPSIRLTAEAAQRRLAEFRSQVASGKRKFEDLAREYSEDGSASRGGDLGWTAPGSFVPEFETAMNALPVNGMSSPIVSRFGVHLIQVMERRQVPVDPKQVREQARAALRERKYEGAYTEWMGELRSRTFIEMREPPL